MELLLLKIQLDKGDNLLSVILIFTSIIIMMKEEGMVLRDPP